MWDTEQLAGKLQKLDADVQQVIRRGKQNADDRLILSGVETAGRNIERLFKFTVATDLEQRLRAVEEQSSQNGDPE